MTRACDMILNRPSSFINLFRTHSAQEATVVFLCHVLKAEIPLQLWVPAELPVFLLYPSETEILTSEIKLDMRSWFLPFPSIKPRGKK